MIDHTPHLQALTKMARYHARTYGVEAEDCLQEALLAWYEPKTQEYLESIDEDDHGKVVHVSCKRAVIAYCDRERAAREGYRAVDVYSYSKGQVASMFPTALDYLLTNETPRGSDMLGRSASGYTDGQGLRAQLIDLAVALEEIPKADRELLLWHYGGVDADEIAERRGINAASVRTTVSRALGRLTDAMNGNLRRERALHEGPQLRQPNYLRRVPLDETYAA